VVLVVVIGLAFVPIVTRSVPQRPRRAVETYVEAARCAASPVGR